MEKIVNITNLTKKYRGQSELAVDNVSFSVTEGEFFTLLGPNGAGKTTIISILTTTLSKTSGDVSILGLDLEKNSSEIRQKLGIIFQKPSLDQNLTAEENIRFHAILYGLYPFMPSYRLMPKEYKEKVQSLSTLLGIQDDIYKPVRTFSGGMMRKLEIIRSLMHEPKLLFLDEPTTGLDPQSRHNLWNYLITAQNKNHTTIFLTTHYLEEAENSNRVCIINKGKIVQIGTPQEIKHRLTEHFLFVATNDNQSLELELNQRHIEYSRNNEMYKIPIKDNTAHQLLRQIETPLIEIVVHQPSLEEAYLELTKEGSTDAE